MGNKYLEEIGYKEYIPEKDDRRWDKFNREIKERGFPSYEVWNLNETFCAWLYSRLAAYLEDASEFICLNFHKFEFEGQTYTEQEAIEYIMNQCKEYMLYDGIDYDEELAVLRNVQKATRLFAEILPTLWW